jgi:hypothetical protein
MMPGIMYSGPLSTRFNPYDLYFMGLMPYSEASTYAYTIYEINPDYTPKNYHTIYLDSLIYGLSLAGPEYFEGDGRRIPDCDSLVTNLKALIVLIQGEDEILLQEDKERMLKLAHDIPPDWETATWGRSKMSISIDFKYSNTVKTENANFLKFELNQNYPNPFNPSTKIRYSIPQTSFVILQVYDILGNELATLVKEEKTIGNYEVEFDGSKLSSGIYFYRLQTDKFSGIKKLILMK